jgi:hypothetical protein
VERFAIEEHAVLGFAVVVQTLAVVGEDEDRRALEVSERPDPGEEPPERRVGGRDLAVVGVRKPTGEGRRRCVRRVRLEEMDEEEPGALVAAFARKAAEPGERGVDRLDARALELAQRCGDSRTSRASS